MGIHLDISSLSELPSVQEVISKGSNHFVVSLPVYAFSLYRRATWTGPGFFVYTDFTKVSDAAISTQGIINSSVPREYSVDGSDFDISMLMSTSIISNKFASIASELRKSLVLPNEFDHDDKDRCKFEDQGVFAKVTFTLKEYKGKLESNYVGLTFINPMNINIIYPQSSPSERKKLICLLERFCQYVSPFIAKRALRNFPLSDFSLTNDGPLLFQEHNRSDNDHDSQSERPKKIQKTPKGTSLLYQQHVSFEDTQRPLMTQTQWTQDNRLPSGQKSQESQDSSLPFYSQESQIKSSPEISNRDLSGLDDFLVSKITLEQLLSIEMTEDFIRRDKLFEVEAYIVGYYPFKPFIVKPFKRTLKASNIRLVLKQSPSSRSQLIAELNTMSELCNFLQVSEIEEVHDKIPEIQKKITALMNNSNTLHRSLRLKCSTMTLHNRFRRPYWTCLNGINELTRNLI